MACMFETLDEGRSYEQYKCGIISPILESLKDCMTELPNNGKLEKTHVELFHNNKSDVTFNIPEPDEPHHCSTLTRSARPQLCCILTNLRDEQMFCYLCGLLPVFITFENVL